MALLSVFVENCWVPSINLRMGGGNSGVFFFQTADTTTAKKDRGWDAGVHEINAGGTQTSNEKRCKRQTILEICGEPRKGRKGEREKGRKGEREREGRAGEGHQPNQTGPHTAVSRCGKPPTTRHPTRTHPNTRETTKRNGRACNNTQGGRGGGPGQA
jgi:hypothetical protein